METWVLREKLFSEENMYAKLTEIAQAEGLQETLKALPYMRDQHAHQYRKPIRGAKNPVPYCVHPLLMACQAHAMGIQDDIVLATALLHDVCEDCNVLPKDLPFSEPVRTAVGLLTKRRDYFDAVGDEQALREYFAGIRTNRAAMLVKCLDRCNNLTTMAGSFSVEKMVCYINEAERYIIPLLDILQAQEPDLADAVFLLKYQMVGLVETQKALLLRYESGKCVSSGAG